MGEEADSYCQEKWYPLNNDIYLQKSAIILIFFTLELGSRLLHNLSPQYPVCAKHGQG